MNRMNKQEAIKYCERKKRLEKVTVIPTSKEQTEELCRKARIKNKETIREVMKKGKIYGDPIVELTW